MHPVESENFVGSLFHRLVDSIKGTFGGSSDESKDKRVIVAMSPTPTLTVSSDSTLR